MNKLILLLAAISLIMSGCREINVSTKVNSDGTCSRSISIYRENDNAKEHLFPYSLDESWSMRKTEKVKDDKNLYTYTRHFENLDTYNSEFNKTGNVSSRIDKEFRWFFTYYKFQEKYKSYNEFNSIPAEEFFSASELERLKKGEDTVWINEQTNLWQQQNVFENLFQALVKGSERINGKKITPESLKERKEEITKAFIADEKGDSETFIVYLNKLFDTNEASLLKKELEKAEAEIGEKIERMGRAEGDYKNEIILPGIIVKTNADALEGNKVIWTFNSDKYLLSDHEMYAESRELNTTFITGSGLVVILLIGGLTIPFVRKVRRY